MERQRIIFLIVQKYFIYTQECQAPTSLEALIDLGKILAQFHLDSQSCIEKYTENNVNFVRRTQAIPTPSTAIWSSMNDDIDSL